MKNFSTFLSRKTGNAFEKRFAAIIISFILAISVFMLPQKVAAQFTAGNIAVLVGTTASANNTTASIVALNTTSSGQSGSSFTIPDGASNGNGLRFSASAGTTCYLANSNDGSLLCFTGANSSTTGSNVNTLNPRGVGTFNNSGTYNLSTTYTGTSGDQTRGATSTNNTTFYIADQGGFYTNGGSSGLNSTNTLCVKCFGGTLYALTASSINTATTGGTYTSLGLTLSSAEDFYLISSGSNGSSFDELYIISGSSKTANTISKYSLVGSTWTANGTYTTTIGGCRMAVAKGGTGAYLYVASGDGTVAANSVVKLTDANGYNSTISITTANNVTLYTAGASATVKGVAFAPVTVLNSSATTLNGFSYITGSGPSASQPLTITGSFNATSGNITITGSTDYLVSTTSSTTGFGTTANLSISASGTISASSANVWVELKSGLSAGNYNGETIAISGGGATTVDVTANGSVTAGTPSITLDESGVTQVSAGDVYQGSTNNIASVFHMNVANANATLSSFNFDAGGTFAAGDVTNFKLYTNTSTTFPGGSPLSTVSATGIANGGTVTFSSLGLACNIGDIYFWITADIAASANTLNTVQIPTLPNSDFTFAAETFNSNSITAGGIQQITLTNYYWNGGSPQTPGTTGVSASGGSGSWGTTGAWVEPASSGTAVSWTDGYGAIFAGTEGSVTLDANRTAASVAFNTNGYTLQTTAIATTAKTPTSILTGTITLSNNDSLILAPYVNVSTPGNGNFGIGSVNGSGSAKLVILAAQSSTAISNLVSLEAAANINVPVSIESAGGSGSAGYAGFTAQSTGTQINGNVTNNSSIGTMIGAQSGFTVAVNGVVSGSAGLTFGQSNTGAGKGTITLANNNTYSGGTFLDVTTDSSSATNGTATTGGTVALGTNNALPTSGNLTIGDLAGDGGTLDLKGYSQTIGTLISKVYNTFDAFITNSGSSTSVLTVTQASDQSFLPEITDGTGGIAIVKNGASLLNLTGKIAFTGGLRINQGEFRLNPSASATLGADTLSGGTLGTTGITASRSISFTTLNITSNSTINLDPSNAHTINFVDSTSGSWPVDDTITITGWQGTYLGGNAGTKGRIYIGTSANGLSSTQLSQIRFVDGSNNIYSATLLSTGELVPDLNINPVLATSPTSINFGGQAVLTNSNSQSFNLTGANLSGFPGTLTVTAPSADFQVSNDNSTWGSSTTISFNAAILSATPVYVKFTPQVAGKQTGNITITGGGVSNPGLIAVSGLGSASYVSVNSGNWSSASTWLSGNIPSGAADYIVISNGNTVTLDQNDTSIASLTINGTLSLSSNSDTLRNSLGSTTVNGTLTLGSALTNQGIFTSDSLTVANGGTFTNNCGNALADSVNYFFVQNGGTYNHNAVGSIAGGNTFDFPGYQLINLGNTSNVVFTKWGQNGGSPNKLPSVNYGNLTLNISTTLASGSWGQSGGINTINGNFNVISTGNSSNVFRFVKTQSLPTITIGGDFNISGTGNVGITNSTTYPTVNVGGSVNVSGSGILDLDGGSGTGTVNFNVTDSFKVSGSGIVERTGNSTSLAAVNFVKSSGNQVFISTAGGINSNKISWTVGNASSTNALQLDSSFIMSSSSTLTVNSNNSIVLNNSNISIDSSLYLLGASTLKLNGNTLTLNLNKNISGTGTFTGSFTSNLNLGGTAGGTFNFTNGSNVLENLLLNGTGTDSLGTMLDITAGNTPGSVTVNSGATLVTNGNLTLLSDANGTARVAPSTGSIVGNTIVERFIPGNSNRAWRLLSVPTSGTQTINAAWQEGQTAGTNDIPGYGTIITAASNNTNWAAEGFDYVQPYSSIVTYDQSNNTWVNVPSMYNTLATTSGYFLYVRGDRSQGPTSSIVPTTNTILRTIGGLYQGTQSAITVPAGKFGLIGNIYASAIDFTNVSLNGGVSDLFYVWDPKIKSGNSLGVYQTFSSEIGWATPIQDAGYGATNTQVQSGEAFFVYAPSTSGTVQLSENSKVVSNGYDVFRPAGMPNAILRTNLFNDSSAQVDATFELFGSNFSDSLDVHDAPKLPNTGENFAILNHNKTMVIDAHQPAIATDTIYFDMWNMNQEQYTLQFSASNLDLENLIAYLHDAHLGTNTPLNLSDTTTISFTVDSSAGSSAANRFSLVFDLPSPVPVTFVNVAAQEKTAGSVLVSWSVSAESGIQSYSVQRSTDGINFTTIGQVAANDNAGGTASYSFTDAQAVTGANYYRIMSVGVSGQTSYSVIVKVVIGSVSATPDITVYPNPVVTGGIINIQLTNQPAGTYSVRLLNMRGQIVYHGSFSQSGEGNSVQSLNLPALAAGVYNLEVASPNGTLYNVKVIIQ